MRISWGRRHPTFKKHPIDLEHHKGKKMKHTFVLELETVEKISEEEVQGKVVMGVMSMFDGADLLDLNVADWETWVARLRMKGKKNG